jgi:hypothetical protein
MNFGKLRDETDRHARQLLQPHGCGKKLNLRSELWSGLLRYAALSDLHRVE